MKTNPSLGEVPGTQAPSLPSATIPDYLQPFIVDQDVQRYSAVDHAVWRFVLLQLHDRLGTTAHPSYCRGLAESGIDPSHIPSIQDMNRCLASIGWRAVCVDGFIPPRAFQAFQAHRILPIAAEIRTPAQLPYTPAPDIIHEAAGHAPLLIDKTYAEYVRSIGAVASRAFASPHDRRVDSAVRRLSDLEAHCQPQDALVREAELELDEAVAALGPPSEAARIARLFWWTAEYGLVGTPKEYRLYGAGLLSSLGESHFCHRPEVDKLPLDERCTELGYDVTRPQPQLFVARDFEHLHDVLESVSQTLACERGGAKALSAAVLSGELSTVYLSDGMQVIGTLDSHHGGTDKGYLVYTQGAALAHRDRMLFRRHGPTLVPLGRLADGTDPRGLDANALTKRAGSSGRVTLRYASGLSVVGTPCTPPWPEHHGLLALQDVAIVDGQRALLHCKEPYPLLLTPELITACAGSASPQCSPLAAEAGTEGAAATQDKGARPRVPRQRELSPAASALNALYDRTLSAPRVERASASPSSAALETIRAEAGRSHPDEWLLYWNLLERFDPCARHTKLARRLQSHLLKLEEHYGGRHPITTGLDYLTRRV